MGQEATEGMYYSVSAKADWNYGLLEPMVKDPEKKPGSENVKPVTANFIWNLSNAPIEIIASAKKIPDWKIMNGVAPQPVTDRTGVYKGKVNETVEKITLVPYGCTKVGS
jgi:hypothetical protein